MLLVFVSEVTETVWRRSSARFASAKTSLGRRTGTGLYLKNSSDSGVMGAFLLRR